MKPILYRPVKPFNVIQSFGANYDYYHTNFGTNGHMGCDLFAPHGTPVYAAHDGTASFNKDAHGGEGVYIAAQGFMTIYWHLIGDTEPKYPNPLSYTRVVKAGDLIGYADNTGAPFESTGDHLHFGFMLLDANGGKLTPNNGFDGCSDPMPYMSGTYAVDIGTLTGLYQRLIPLLEALIKGLQGKSN